MKYCSQCGEKIKDNSRICMYCGAINEVNSVDVLKEHSIVLGKSVKKNAKKIIEFSKDKSQDIKSNEEIQNIKNKAKDNLKSFKLKKWHIGIAAAIVILMGIGSILPKFNTPEKTIDKFQEAVINNDVSELKKIIKSEDKRLDISDDNLSVLMGYYKTNPSELNKHIGNLKEQVKNENLKTNDYIKLVKEKGLFQQKYYISIVPRYIKLESQYDNTEIELKSNNLTITGNEENKEIGPLMPGEYEISAKLKDEFSNDTKVIKINLFEANGEVANIKVLTDLNHNRITCNDNNAILFIDGESTDKKVKDIDSIVGLKDGTKVYCVVNVDNTEYKSDELKVEGNQQLNFKIDDTLYSKSDEDIKKEAGELISRYLKDFPIAVNNNNSSIIQDYLYEGSAIYNEQLRIIPSIYNQGIREKYISHQIKDVKYDKKSNTGNLFVTETYEITYKDGKIEKKDFNNIYEFKYNDKIKKYQLTKIVESTT